MQRELELKRMEQTETAGRALDEGILLQPALIIRSPGSLRTIVGSISQLEVLRQALNLPEISMSTDEELSRLVRALHETQQRILELTGGTVDAVLQPSGASYPLHQAQEEQLRRCETALRQYATLRAAILDALPAQIALLDPDGRIVTVNEDWRCFAVANVFPTVDFGVGRNYLEVCENAHGDCSDEALDAATGIRAVLNGEQAQFTLEYPCHSPTEQRWFRLMVTPVEDRQRAGAVVMHIDITERKLAEDTLRESERRHRILFELNPQPMWVYDLVTLRFLEVNNAAVNHYGYSRDEFLNMTITEIRPAEDVPALLKRVAQAKTGINHAGIWRHRLKNGRIIRAEIHTHTLDFGGRRADMVLAQDVTGRLEAEEALRASEELFRQLAENIDDVFWITDPTTHQGLYISPAYERIWGRSYNDLHRDSGQWVDAIHAADRPRIVAALQQESTGRYHEEYRIVRPDGTIRWISDRAFPIRDDTGVVYRIAGVARDITELKRSQINLRERIKELRCLYRVLELTTDDTRSVETICADIVSVLPSSMLHADAAVARVVLAGVEHKSKDWQPPISSLRSQIISDGQSIGFVEVGYRDAYPDQGTVNGRFLAEEKMLLDGVAIHISRMLGNRRMEDKLRQSQRLESIGQMTGGIAHDFNNLLTVILGNAELLNEELASDSRLRPIAEVIVRGAQRGAELTHRLLAFARKQPLEPEAINVNRLITGMDTLLHRTLGEHIEIQFVGGTGLWPALVDPTQLENALLNLCLNARDAMPGGGQLTIETTNTELDQDYTDQYAEVQPGTYIRVAVSDTGTGIAPEHRDRVFEPFYTTKKIGKGTGLGLSMVYGFIKQSNGHITLYSEPGEGTTVQMFLPRAARDAAPAPEPGTKPDDETGVSGGNAMILLVEDDASVRSYAEGQLKGLGYRVLAATNGPEALTLLRQRDDIDLLFTDIVMPGGMNGRELADIARSIKPGLKVLYTSGYPENAMMHHGRLDPGVQLLSKPYRRGDLSRKIREVMLDLRAGT